jgi:hypothetical protein
MTSNTNSECANIPTFFGIPKVVKSVFKDISKIEQLTFNYFIDEFENFEPQQRDYIDDFSNNLDKNPSYSLISEIFSGLNFF